MRLFHLLALLYLLNTPVFFAQSTRPMGMDASASATPLTGLFAPRVTPANAPGDFTGDGLIDVIEIVGDQVRVHPGKGNLSFAEEIVSNVGLKNSFLGMASADLDLDGDLDLVVDLSTFEIRILLNEGNGHFVDWQLFSALGRGTAILADWDGDGDPDIVSLSGSGVARTYYNNGNAIFAAGPFGGTVGSLFGVAGDINGDGLADLVGSTRNAVYIVPNTGAGFGTEIAVPSPGATDPRIADVNGDGKMDVLCGHDSSPNLLVHLNDGQGSLHPAQVIPVGGVATEGSNIGPPRDFDGDGDIDVLVGVVLERPFGRETRGLRFMANDGAGVFTPGALIVTGFSSSFEVADLKGDGNFDVLTASGVFLHKSGGRFAAYEARPSPLAHSPSYIHKAPLPSADVDADGDLDLLYLHVTNMGFRTIILARNDGAGRFTTEKTSAQFNTDGGLPLFADVDGNGSPDFVHITRDSGTSAGVFRSFLNDGSGSFTASAGTTTNLAVWDMAAADLDQDGDIDVVLSADEADQIVVAFNDGLGAFSGFVSYPMPGLPRGIALGDVDLDGDADAVVANAERNVVDLFRNNGTGVFSLVGSLPTGDSPVDVLLLDLDRNGRLDVATANSTGVSLSVLLQFQGGGFANERRTSLPSGALTITAADLNGDGHHDLVLSSLFTLLGRGDGSFQPTREYGAPGSAWNVTAGDFDGDGDADLAAICSFALGRPITLYRNQLR